MIVTREIGKFRETMKIREAEKEEQDKKRKGSKLPRRKAKSREGEGGGDLCENQEDLATR